MKRTFVIAAIGLVGCVGCGSGDSRKAPPSGLTSHGSIVWEFEALLRDTFGQALLRDAFGTVEACEGPRGRVNFVVRPCAPLSDYNFYRFTFADARGSTFARTRKRPAHLGNVIPVQVGGQYVRCKGDRWLVMVRGIFPLACVKPLG
jgi:hypothetical protein